MASKGFRSSTPSPTPAYLTGTPNSLAMAMAMLGLLFLLLGLNLSVAEVAEGAILVLMIRQLPAEMAVTVEPVRQPYGVQ